MSLFSEAQAILRDAVIDVYGVAAVLTPQPGGAPVSLVGSFRAPSRRTDLGEDLGLQSIAPRFDVREEDAPNAAIGDLLTIGADNYEIVDVEPSKSARFNRLILRPL